MNIGNAQSQSTILSTISTRTTLSSQTSGKPSQPIAAKANDLLGLSNEIDPGFARSVLQDTVETRLETALSEAGVDLSAKEVLTQVGDTSPEATADRIVEFATGFLEQHKLAHSDLEAGEQLDEFVSLIKGAIETGFEEAGAMLSQLGQVPGAVQGDIDKTLELVMKGIDDFATDTLSAIENASESSEEGESVDATSVV